jgi:hypothetical protein
LGVELFEGASREDFWEQFRRCLPLAIPLAYPIAILALLSINVIPKPTDIHGFGPQYIPWQQGLDYVVGRPAEHVRNIVIMMAVPLLVVRGKSGFFLFLYICAVWLLCLNPLLAHWWMRHITASCYFRFNYLLPLPLLCAMLPSAAHSWTEAGSGALRRRMLTDLALLGILATFMHSYRVLSIMPRSAVRAWKSPLEYQLLKENTDFARAAGKYIAHSKLLAPGWTASCELPLLFPQMKVVAPRLVIHYFANAGNAREGSLRQMAQVFVEGEKPVSPQRAAGLPAAFRTVIKSGRANAVAAPEAESARVLAALQAIDPRWHRILDAGGLVLMLPGEVEPESRK